MNLSYPFEEDPRAVAKPKPGPGGIPVVAQAPQVVAAEPIKPSMDAPQQTQAQTKPDLGSATLADYGKVAAAGGLSLGQGLAHLGNVATGGALERVTGAEGYLANQAEGLRQSLSPRMQEARAKEFITDDLSLGPAWADPHAIGSVVVENIPMAAATMLPSARAASVAKSNALRAGATEAAANQAAARAGAVAGGISEGAISGGMNASEAGREIRGMEEDKIGLNPKYQAMLASGKSPGEARDQLAREAERDVGLITGAVTGLTGAWFGKYLGKLVGEGSPSGRIVAGIKGGAIEGGTEVAQSGAEQVVSNAAVQQYGDPSRDILAGVPNAMAAGLVGGGVTGGGMAAAFGAPQAETAPVDQAQPAQPAAPQVATQVDAAAHEAATSPLNERPEPTEAQARAGNYRKGHIKLEGLDISVENAAGSERRGTDEDGKPWATIMSHHYGYIKGTKGKDKDHLDVFVGPKAEDPATPVFVVDQVKMKGQEPTTAFDEHKVMLGFGSQEEALNAYAGNYSWGAKSVGAITPMSFADFKVWSADPKNTQKPAGRIPRRFASAGTLGMDPGAGLATVGERFPLSLNVANLARPAAQQPAAQPVTASTLGMDPNAGLADSGTPPAEPINLASMAGPRATMEGLGMPAADAGLGTQGAPSGYAPTSFINGAGITPAAPTQETAPNAAEVPTVATAPPASPVSVAAPPAGPTAMEPAPTAAPAPEGVAPAPVLGAGNTLVTPDRAKELRDKLREKLGLGSLPEAANEAEVQNTTQAPMGAAPAGDGTSTSAAEPNITTTGTGSVAGPGEPTGAAEAGGTVAARPNDIPAPEIGEDVRHWWKHKLTAAGRRAAGERAGLKKASWLKRAEALTDDEARALGDLFQAPAETQAQTESRPDKAYLVPVRDDMGNVRWVAQPQKTEEPAAEDKPKSAPFDPVALQAERDSRITAARERGAQMLDKVEPAVETMRGLRISYLHGDEKGVITTVGTDDLIRVKWETGPHAGENSVLTLRDRKDYEIIGSGYRISYKKRQGGFQSDPVIKPPLKPAKATEPNPTTEEVAAKARDATNKKAAKQRAAMEIDPKVDDLLAAIAKAGGLNMAEAESQGIDPAHFKRRGFRIYRVFTKSGDTFDGMAERLNQYGYPVTDADGTYSPNALLAALSAALDGGKRQIAAAGVDAEGERLLALAQNREPDVDWGTFDEWTEEHRTPADESRMTALRNWGVGAMGQDAFEDLEADVSVRVGDGASDVDFMNALEEAVNEAVNQREGQEQPGRDEGVGQLTLEGQTPADIQRQEAARRAAERAAADARARDQVEGPESFVLTGSSRPADELAARGQTSLFDEARKVAPAAKGWGESNTFITADRAEELRKQLKEKLEASLGTTFSGIDPEMMMIGAQLAAFHIEAGARSFLAFAKAISDDLGASTEQLRQYLRSWYNGARDMMEDAGMDVADMDDPDAVRAKLKELFAPKQEKTPPPPVEQAQSGTITDQLAAHFLAGNGFKTIVEARAWISERTGSPIKPGTPEAKRADEQIEQAGNLAARRLVAAGESQDITFQGLSTLSERMPSLNVRTSTSIAQQAYSTPFPLAYLASQRADAKGGKRVLESTAGNGALLMEVAPGNAVVNELNPDRAAFLRSLGYEVTEKDATRAYFAGHWRRPELVDRVIINPPFGAVRGDDGQSVVFNMTEYQRGYTTTEIDHAIVFNSLKAMADDGRAVLIIGAPGNQAKSQEARSDAYNGKSKRTFFHALYNQYRVTDHFTVSGDLYTKQGAGWPVDVIVIEGRGKSAMRLPAAAVPRMIETIEDLQNELRADPNRAVSEPTGTATQPGPEPAGDDAGSVGAPVGGRPGGRPGPGGPRPVLSGLSGTAGTKPGGVDVSDAAPGGTGESGRPGPQPVKVENPYQTAYAPGSASESVGTLVPVNMAGSIQEALAAVMERHGGVDAYVAESLGYSLADLRKYFSAEQVDALALAMDQMDRGAGFIIGDQTGVGKGRVVAAMIRHAIRNGRTPIFVTEKPNLFGDMMRDLQDIGMGHLVPLTTNADIAIPTDREGREWAEEAEAARERGERPPPRRGQFVASRTGAAHSALLSEVAATGDLKKAGYDVVFTTYNQLQMIGGNRVARHEMVDALAEGGMLLLDESHNAGGTEANTRNRGGNQEAAAKTGRAKFVRDLAGKSASVFYSSATFAKRPDVMDLYFRTDMGMAGDVAEIQRALVAGGVPLQQVVSAMLAKAGQYIRREKSFDGIDYATTDVEINKKLAEDSATVMRRIMEFDRVFKAPAVEALSNQLKDDAAAVSLDGATGGAGANSTNFTSVMHNLINQMLLALKAGPAAERAIAHLKEGRKPVVTVANTMGTMIEEYAAEVGLVPGDGIDLTFGDLFKRYLEKTRNIRVKDVHGDSESRPLTDEELGPAGVRYYNELMRFIERTDLEGLSVSPIDIIHSRIREAGFSTGEITGRTATIDYSGGSPIFRRRPGADLKPAGRSRVINGFNSGKIDALIINQAGATGLSLHSSKTFSNQNQRVMILAQPELNIDTHMQMLGRVNRTGQVNLPLYEQLAADIAAEKRPAAVLSKKMAMLNANTTAGKDSALKAKDVPDFMNQYGDRVAAGVMADNPEIHAALGSPLAQTTNGLDPVDAIRKVSGRIPILPIAQQEDVYGLIESGYRDLIEQLDSLGENELEAKTLELDAKVVKTKTVVAGKGGSSPFAAGAEAETVDVKKIGKPYTREFIDEQIRAGLEQKEGEDFYEARRRFREEMKAFARDARDKLVQDANDAMDPDQESSRKRRDSEVARYEAQYARVVKMLELYHPGDAVLMNSPRGLQYVAKVGKIAHAKKASKNPLAAGAWNITFYVADAARQIKLPLSQINLDATALEGTWEVSQGATDEDFAQMLESGLSGSREERVILTGNMLAAYGAFSKGRIINYTTDSGEVKQGVLMPAKFDLEEEMNKSPAKFSAEQAIGYLATAAVSGPTPLMVKTWDGKLRLMKHSNDLFLMQTDASKRMGGDYYLNKKLTEAAGGDFVKVGSMMRVEFLGDRLSRVIRALYEKGGSLQSATHHDEAKAYLEANPEGRPASAVVGGGQSPRFSVDRVTRPANAPAGKLKAAMLQSRLETMVAGWKGLAGVQVRVVQDEVGLPESVAIEAEAIRGSDPGLRPRGVFVPGNGIEANQIILVANNLKSVNEAFTVLAHEAIGHLGVQQTLGEGMNDVLDMIATERADQVAMFAEMYGQDMADERGRRLAAEEYLAHLAENPDNLKTSSVLRRVIQYIRQFLREIGVKLTLTDHDIREILVGARKYITEGGRYRGGLASRFSFAGGRSQTADIRSLARAQNKIEKGQSRGDVLDETGWFHGDDGQWRYEINDSDAKLADGYEKHKGIPAVLFDVLDHPALQAAYPELNDIGVFIEIDRSYEREGSFNPNRNIITVKANSEQQALSALLHEIQHGIQNIEGFATGGNTDMFASGAGKVDARGFSLRSYAEQEMREGLAAKTAKAAEIGYQKGLNTDRVNRLNEKTENLARYGAYKRLAGEVESRNVQRRQDMSPGDRLMFAPWATQDVQSNNVIVVYNGREMRDAPPPANAPDIFAQDMQAQAAWLNEQAKAAGFESADALALKEPVRFVKLAEDWRAAHPWPKKVVRTRKTPRLRRGVERMMQDAESHKSWSNWYDRHVEILRDLFDEDADLFRDLLAITSQAASVATNVSIALKAYRQIKLGLPFEGVGLGKAALEKYAAGEPISGLKIGEFAKAMAGVGDAVVTDRHMARYLFGVGKPTKAMHTKAEKAIKTVSRRLGWTPREVQAALWAFQQHTNGVELANDYEAVLRRKIQEIRSLRQELVGPAGGPGGEGGGGGARFSLGAGEQTRTQAFREWLGDSKVVAADGSPLVVYHGTTEDKLSGADRARGGISEFSVSHFGTLNVSSEFADRTGGHLYPVYLSIENPLRLKDSGISHSTYDLKHEVASALGIKDIPHNASWRSLLKMKGYDGIVYLNRREGYGRVATIWADAQLHKDWTDDQWKSKYPQATDSYIPVAPTQIKSAIGNTGAFSPTNPDIRFSLANPALASALRKAGLGVDDRTIVQRIKDWAAAFWADLTGNFKDRVIEGGFDRFHGIKLAERTVLGNLPAEQSGYVAARLSTGASSVLYGMLTHGAPEWRDGILSMKEGSKGVLQILEPVKDNLSDYLGWMVGVRAKRLMSEGKENNLTSEEIEELLALADGKEETFKAVAADLDAFKKSVLDVAQEAGLIDGETRPAWDHADYIPFYREATEGRVKGPFTAKGLSHQSSGIKKLRGGEAAIHDPLENLMRNFGHLIDASMKNMALRRVTSNLDGSEYLTEIPSAEFERSIIPLAQVKARLLQFGMDPQEIDALPADALGGFAKLWSVKAPDRPNVVRVMDGGKARYFEVADPALLRGLTAVNQEAFGGPVKVMREFKRLLTAGVTSDPSFWARNAIRDAMHAWTINEDGFRFGIDSVRGAVRAFKEDGGLVDMLFAGASFQGGHLNANDPEAMADAIRQALAAKGFSKRQADDYMKTVVLSAEDLWRRYRRIGDAVENASREAVFEAAGKAGKSRAEQVFEAKDLMDYSMQGNWTLIRLMGDVLPFFNARLQGLYKLGRAGAVPGINTKKKAILRGGMIMAASILLLMLNKDREEYEELEDWDKDSNWHFWIGGEHIRIPKPFEIGLLYGTMPERITRSALGMDKGGKTLDRMWQGAYSTLEVNPIPQMFRPLAETWANRNMFTGRSIENQSDEGKLPSARYNEGTSPTMRALGALTSDTTGLSPKELEHLWRGYLGAMGAYALGAADMIHRLANGQDPLPEARPKGIPVIGSFWRSGQASNSRYTTEFYDMLREVEQIYRTANAYKKEGDPAKARELREREANKLSTRKILTGANEKIRNLNKRIDQARRDQTLSVEERTRLVDELNAKKLDLAKRIIERVEDRF